MTWDLLHFVRILLPALTMLLLPALGFVLGIGPPSLNGVLLYVITVAVECLAVLAGSWWKAWPKSNSSNESTTLRHTTIAGICVLLALTLVYLWVYRSRVVTIDGERGIKGFTYSDFALRIQKGRDQRGQPPFTDGEMIRSIKAANRNENLSTQQAINRLWTRPSITLASITLALVWVSFFGVLSPVAWILPRLLPAGPAQFRQVTPGPMEKDYEDFVLLVTANPGGQGGYFIRVIESPAGEANGLLAIDPASGEMQVRLKRINDHFKDDAVFEQFGTDLFEAVFRGSIGNVYRISEGLSGDPKAGLRLRLQVEPPELLQLPWELLFDTLHKRFLGRSPRDPLSYYLPLPDPPKPLSVEPPLRLLIVVSNPIDLGDLGLPRLDAKGEIDRMNEALREWTDRGLVTTEVMDNAIVPDTEDRIRRFRPHVLHFIGHGGFSRIGGVDRACLVMEDEQRRHRYLHEEDIRVLLDDSGIRLVVLNACETATAEIGEGGADTGAETSAAKRELGLSEATTSSVRAMTGIAPCLVQTGIPAVVAMRYPITDQAAIVFSREFYRALASGMPVDAALADTRKGLSLELGTDDRSWFTPVIFMRTPDGRIFDISVERDGDSNRDGLPRGQTHA